MRTTVLIPATLFVTLALQACEFGPCEKGAGSVAKQALSVAAFQGIAVQGSMEVRIARAGTQHVEAEGQPNVIALITTEVKDGVWHIGTTTCYSTDKPLIVHISTPAIHHVSIQGSGDVKSKDTFTVDAFTATVQGSGDLNMAIEARTVNAVVQGSGDIGLKGRCEQLDARVQGSGDIDARGLIATRAHAGVAGSGDIAVQATEELNASVQGSGDVSYTGQPAKLNKSVNGSGEVKPVR